MSKRPKNMTSYTELSKLAGCEMAWSLRYREGVKGEDKDFFFLGRLLDVGINALLLEEEWYVKLQAAVAEEGADPTKIVLADIEGPPSTAAWLIRRYAEHYSYDDIQVAHTQLDLKAPVPGTKQVHQAIIDEVWVDSYDDLWMVERKSYGRRDRLALVEVDPQLTLNLWVLRENGYDVKGIVFDGIYTYRWKPEKPTQKALIDERAAADPAFHGLAKGAQTAWAREQVERHPGIERPLADSFDRLWLDRTDAHIAAALDDARAVISRRNTLRRGALPVRNIGPLCRSCQQRPVCFERLAFPQLEVDVIDDLS